MRGLSSSSIHKRANKTVVLSLPVVLRDYQFTTPNALIQRWPFWVTWLIRTCGMFVTKEKIAEHGTKDKKKKKSQLETDKKKKKNKTQV